MILDGELIRLEVYDTAGQDEFAALREASLREADGFLLVFSVSSRERCVVGLMIFSNTIPKL